MKDLCARDHKTLMKLKTQLNGKILSVPWKKNEHCLNIYILPKALYTLNAVSVKIPMAFFTKIEKKTILKFVWNDKGPQIPKVILRINKTGGITRPDIKVCYKIIVIIIV